MRPEDFKKMLMQQPFAPFRVYLTDGASYDIKHPDLVLLTRSTMIIGTEEKLGSGIADDYVYCSLLHIVRLELLPQSSTQPA